MITLHYVATANGLKIAIALAEMALDYEVIDYPLFEGHHLTAELRRLNPNCTLPVLVDPATSFAAQTVTTLESCAVLLYLAQTTVTFLPSRGAQPWGGRKWRTC